MIPPRPRPHAVTKRNPIIYKTHGEDELMATQHAPRAAKGRKVVAEFRFEPVALRHGYADRTLRIDLSTGTIETRPVDQRMKDLWTGGKGFDLWLMFQEVNKATKWNSPENPICFSVGPLGGTASFPGAGKTLVTSISPITTSIMDCNVGGYFGPYLKFAGFDAMMVTGKAAEETVVIIDAVKNVITIERAPEDEVDSHLVAEQLTEAYADDLDDRRNISVVSAGRAAEHSRMGVLNFSFYDWRRGAARLKQAGRGGIGTVFRDKKVKALVIKNRRTVPSWSIEPSKAEKLVVGRDHACERACACAPDAETVVDQAITRWNGNPECVVEMLQEVQDRLRHIPAMAIDRIGRRTETPKPRLYHIATFYKGFTLAPQGETRIQVCVGTACNVKGAARIVEALERELSVKAGQTTKDGKFTLEVVPCLGFCGVAPVVKVGDEIIGNVKAERVKDLLAVPAALAAKGGGARG